MKTTIILVVLLIAGPAFAGVDEGTIVALDGMGRLRVATKNNGVLTLEASRNIMGAKPKIPNQNWPHVYGDLMHGDVIKVHWGKLESTGQPTAYGLKILQRAEKEPMPPKK